MLSARPNEAEQAISRVESAYPETAFPEDGTSIDCQSASVARLTCRNIRYELKRIMDERDENEADAPRGQAVASDRERGIWRAAITLANNICVQESDDHNADDQIRECNATAHCAKRIREYVEPEDEMLDELLREAHVPPPSPVGEADGMREWQPIETAPTDETMFLAGWPDGRMAVLKGSILAAQKGRATPTPEHLQFQCTHWQPLPEPPK